MSLENLLRLPPNERKSIISKLNRDERLALQKFVSEVSPYTKYQDDPVAFVQEALHETLWSKQKEILESVRDNKRTAVPACHAPGKSHIAA